MGDSESPGESTPREIDRRTAAMAAAPLLALGLANVGLALLWGADPLWGFVVFLPMVATSALAWFAFRAVRQGKPRSQ